MTARSLVGEIPVCPRCDGPMAGVYVRIVTDVHVVIRYGGDENPEISAGRLITSAEWNEPDTFECVVTNCRDTVDADDEDVEWRTPTADDLAALGFAPHEAAAIGGIATLQTDPAEQMRIGGV